jgi:hypothetical protein
MEGSTPCNYELSARDPSFPSIGGAVIACRLSNRSGRYETTHIRAFGCGTVAVGDFNFRS